MLTAFSASVIRMFKASRRSCPPIESRMMVCACSRHQLTMHNKYRLLKPGGRRTWSSQLHHWQCRSACTTETQRDVLSWQLLRQPLMQPPTQPLHYWLSPSLQTLARGAVSSVNKNVQRTDSDETNGRRNTGALLSPFTVGVQRHASLNGQCLLHFFGDGCAMVGKHAVELLLDIAECWPIIGILGPACNSV